MTKSNMNPVTALRKYVENDEDLLRGMVKAFAEAVMSAEADGLCGASFGERSDECTNRRNGYRLRDWNTRAGTVALDVPRLREGSNYPSWLLEPRKRAERALAQVVVECYVRGVSTRKVDGLVKSMGRSPEVAGAARSATISILAYGCLSSDWIKTRSWRILYTCSAPAIRRRSCPTPRPHARAS